MNIGTSPRILAAALFLALLGGGGGARAADAAENSGDPADFAAAPSPCAAIIATAEKTEGIPRRLLTAISLAESGRYDADRREIIAWPWSINAEGAGRFFATKKDAIAAVKKLQARGVTSIDVGCMQVNLHHHADAFASLDAAFDPETNVAYAARFLTELRDETRSWSQAVAFYHSTSREFSAPYRSKVYRLWAEVRRRDAEKKRQEVIEAYLERRAAAEEARRAAKRDPS
ncbi:MAG TPA: transglycosylase SLT domain-containing protein [Alphaproteobacteria bacterium]|jgi:hypothetical protein|nr:transglycosylase SLT domain-containing protein [Alphaproteobacteria bacterium]